MNQQKLDAIAALFGDASDPVTALDIGSAALNAELARMKAAEIAAAPPYPVMSDEEWAVRKAFMMDRTSNDSDWITAYRDLLTAVQQNRKDDIPLLQDLLFKRARIMLYAQMEV